MIETIFREAFEGNFSFGILLMGFINAVFGAINLTLNLKKRNKRR